MRNERKKIEELCGEYFNKKGEGKDYFRNALRTHFLGLKSVKNLHQITKILAVNLAEIAYINDADAIKCGEIFTGTFDFGFELGVGAKIFKTKAAKKSLGRLLLFLARKLRRAESDKLSAESRGDDLRLSIKLLMRGKSEIVVCPVCKGTGKVEDDDDLIKCWDCDGDKKVIQRFEMGKK